MAAFLTYTGVFCALLLPKLLPTRPGRILSNSPADGAIFLWSLGWWPHAIAHGALLPYSRAVFAPEGINLAWTTSIPVPSVLLAPVTRLFGVFAAFNTLSLLAPITAAWATYLLVHRITGRWLPSVVAGSLFALSPLEMTQVAVGHLNLSLVGLVPLATYLVVRRLEGSLRPRSFVALLGLVLAGELGVSTEVFVTTTLFGGIALLLLYVFDRGRRPALRRCTAHIGLSYLVAGVLASPMLYTAFAMPHPPGLAAARGSAGPISGVQTSFNLAPSSVSAGIAHPSRAGSWSAVVLLQLPLLAVLAHLMWRRRRAPIPRALTATALIALILSAGIVVVGSRALPTPWSLATHVPFLRLVRPQRLTMFAWLIAAVGAGMWLAERPRSLPRLGVGALVVASTLPVIWWGAWTSEIQTSPFVAGADIYLTPGENVLIEAGPGPATLQLVDLASPTVWQVESDFSFRLADAYVGSFPPPLPLAVRRFVLHYPLPAGQTADILEWLRQAGVGAVLIVRPTPAILRQNQDLLGTEPLRVGGVVIFRVADRSAKR